MDCNRYLTYADFCRVYGTEISVADFERFEFEAELEVDRYTTTIDNVKKLRVAFPTDRVDAEAVKRCVGKLVDVLYRFNVADTKSISASGDVAGGAIASVSSGSESISYNTSASASALAEANKSDVKRAEFTASIVRHYLSGREDANHVNLLYGGVYPHVQRHDNAL